ncbi:MAG: thioredoxin domain-containing protein [Chromatiaceae bacterium]|jgi:hypothetical protein
MTAHRLRDATSPYLQQHADNPVDWWPWCAEALDLARREDKPILLSIGYSACHWCHVMAHESFEDETTARLMNRLFVNIKVDREERPDLDRIYQTSHQLLARRAGGWPLTVFLTPDDNVAFFAGTYFPPAARHGLPAFRDVLQQIERAYRDQGDAIRRQNESLCSALQQIDATPRSDDAPDAAVFDATAAQLAEQFDAMHGGFGGAPKFPHPGTLRFLLRHGRRSDDGHASRMALHTLDRMANGGIHDHLAGGFCRYSVDAEWMIPHFEKMLYDNGQLMDLYAEAWGMTRRPLYRHVCERLADWLITEMQLPSGAYCASLDADSEGEEGRYYVWSPDAVRSLLSDDEYRVFAPRFGLDRPPNFEGRWHLHVFEETGRLAETTGLPPRDVRRHLLAARNTLLAARRQRVPPGRDEKVLTSWNALMIKGMARAGRLLERDDWLDSAAAALGYLQEVHFDGEGLRATSRDGRARLTGYLDDYAYLLDAVLELLQARWRSEWLDFALVIGRYLVAHFEDPEAGGFFFTADNHEALVHRPKPLGDDAMPSGNAVAIEGLQLLAAISGDMMLQDAADRALRAAWPAIERAGYAHVGLLEALHGYLEPPELLIVRGRKEALDEWRQALKQAAEPGRRAFLIPADAAGLPEALAAKTAEPDRVVAYRCRGHQCEPPFSDPAELHPGEPPATPDAVTK